MKTNENNQKNTKTKTVTYIRKDKKNTKTNKGLEIAVGKKARKKLELIKALEKSLGNVSDACSKVGVNRTVFYDYMKDDERFAFQVNDVRELKKDYVESQLLKNIREQKETSIIFYLKTQAKDRGYVERQEHVANIQTKQIVSSEDAFTLLETLSEQLNESSP